MRSLFLILPLALLFAGCSNNEAEQASAPVAESTAPVAQPATLTPTQELAKYCRVCVVDKGERIEEFLPARLDTPHDGKTYKFCADICKKKFDADKKRYLLKKPA